MLRLKTDNFLTGGTRTTRRSRRTTLTSTVSCT